MRLLLLIFSFFLLLSCDNNQKNNEEMATVWEERLALANIRLKSSREREACIFCRKIEGGCLCSDQDGLAYHSYLQYAENPTIKQTISLVILDPNTTDVKAVQSFVNQNGQEALEQVYKDCGIENQDKLMVKSCKNTINNL